MTKTVVISGMHRTGHHAIAVWLLHQRRRVYDFAINTITPWLFKVENDQGCSLLANNPLKSDHEGSNEHPDKNRFADIVSDIRPCSIFLTHEQEKLSQVAWACAHSPLVLNDKVKPQMVVVLRDFKNWIASCIKMAERDDKSVDSVINNEKIDTYINHCNLIDNNHLTYVLYNNWVEEEGYRQEICEELGLHFTDAALNQLSIFGGGSSFDGMKHIKTASLMKVNKRYKELEDHPDYKRIIKANKDALSLSDDIFGRYV